jgi:hypothetical protein
MVVSPSELASEGEERSVRSSRTPSGGEDAIRYCTLSLLAGLVQSPGCLAWRCCLVYTCWSRSMVLQLTPLWVVLWPCTAQ